MYAIEFRAKIKNGMIELPKKFRNAITDTVKVIILKEDSSAKAETASSQTDIISRLVASPLEHKEFSALKRDDIYAR